ncbi:MAG: hypothetical protein ACNA7E_05220 [Wenzhouxiangellaceae bacterium]
MFDTEKNLLSTIFSVAIGALVVIGLLAFVVLGRVNVDRIASTGAPEELLSRTLAERPVMGEISAYLSVIEQPVFFPDRRLPVPQLAAGDDEQGIQEPEPEPAVEIPDLEAFVAGIILTPETKLAMITDRGTNETLLLREGMAMAGDKSAWKVESIQPRTVEFATEGGRRARLEMEVETRALKSGQPVVVRTSSPEPDAEMAEAEAEPGDAEAEARARAEEIRRRVAERRAQLRAEAERRAQQGGNGN